MGSPGIESLKWLLPARPRDTLRVAGTVTDMREARSNPGLGVLQYSLDVRNQDGETVMTMLSTAIMRRQESARQKVAVFLSRSRPAVARNQLRRAS